VVKNDKADETVEGRPIVIGVTYQGMTVIKSGVQAGETVVTDGQLRLSPGAKIVVKNSNSSTNAP
jgi:multidrug efflux system membrane fusion protein